MKIQKTLFTFQKCNENFRKWFRFSKKRAFEHVRGFPLNYQENTCDRQSTFYQTVLRFQIWWREKFFNSISCINGNLREKCCRVDFSSVWDPWKRLISKGVIKQDLSGIQVTTFLGPNNLQNIEAMKLIFFSKMRKILCRLQNCNENLRECFRILKQWRFNMLREFLLIMTTIHVIKSQPFTKQ